jgi:hypothetical protein
MPTKRGRRRLRGAVARRWIAVGALVLVALLYYRPIRAYVDASGQVSRKSAAVRRLQAERDTLERRLRASATLTVLAREARSLGYVRKGEHLYIVKGIQEWRKRQRGGNAPRRAR